MRSHHSRRDFLQIAALSLGALGLGPRSTAEAGASQSVSIVRDPADAVASAAPVRWAIQEFGDALTKHGIHLQLFASIEQTPASGICIVATGCDTPIASTLLKNSAVKIANTPESLGLVPSTYKDKPVLLACGRDVRGLMYGLLELADRVQHADDPMQAVKVQKTVVEQPFNAIRSVGRLFSSDVEDKPWFNNREFWPAYFAMLAAQRFNRFNLSFGIGYDSLQNVADAYFLFTYPFFLAVPGYNVRAINLPDAERDRNLEMLQFISSQAVAHGIDFQLGIWTHGYQWIDSPHPNYTIDGLTPENHAAYSRDALATLLKACPAISGVTIRTHGESGVHEGSYAFWKTVLQGVPQSGRKVEIDLHTKGLDQKLIDGALATGMPLKLSPKYWAEHMGMPYHQTAIRDLEMPQENAHPESFYALSTGSRIFTRYGYADFLREDRPYGVVYRIWPGTHRFLLWGDPVTTASHSRAFRFCGSDGVEWYEPLSFKGRRGSGIAGGRCAYADASLNPHWDWEKYSYTYRQWGRLLYNPDADPDTWQRHLRKQFQAKAPAIEAALASATRIIPIVITAHLPSAANDTYGPEFYTNQSMMDPTKPSPYGDTPAPKVFENVSPLDPQLFSRISDFASELLKGNRTGKYSPIEVAQWLEDLAENVATRLAEAEGYPTGKSSPEFRRIAQDVRIQIGLGRFFAAKFRSAVLYAIYEQSGDYIAIEQALKAYGRAREIWAKFAGEAKDVYVHDMTFGPLPHQRGHWMDRLPAIDADVEAMAQKLMTVESKGIQSASVRSAIQEATGRPQRNSFPCVHTPPARYVPQEPLEISFSIKGTERSISALLYYRHVNQAERYKTVEMQQQNGGYRAAIPGTYANGKYSLQYYFELKQGPEKVWLYPGFTADLANQPYFVVRPASGTVAG